MQTPGQESPDNQAIRELRDELKDLNKNTKKSIQSTDRFNRVATWLSFTMLFMAMMQVVVSIFPPQDNVSKWVVFITFLGGLIFFVVMITRKPIDSNSSR